MYQMVIRGKGKNVEDIGKKIDSLDNFIYELQKLHYTASDTEDFLNYALSLGRGYFGVNFKRYEEFKRRKEPLQEDLPEDVKLFLFLAAQ